jgi:hypothetical protein
MGTRLPFIWSADLHQRLFTKDLLDLEHDKNQGNYLHWRHWNLVFVRLTLVPSSPEKEQYMRTIGGMVDEDGEIPHLDLYCKVG